MDFCQVGKGTNRSILGDSAIQCIIATMDSSVLTAVVAASTSLAVVVATHFLQRKREDEKQWRQERLTYYRDLMKSISDIVKGNEATGGQKRFSDLSNVAPLYAPVNVTRALYQFRDAVRTSASDEERSRGDILLTALVDAMRSDLGLKGAFAEAGVEIRLWASGPPDLTACSRCGESMRESEVEFSTPTGLPLCVSCANTRAFD